MNENKKVQELLNISLIIDESNITHIDIDAKKPESVNFLLGKVCKKYNLDNNVKEKLGKEINKRIDDLIINKKNENRKKKEQTINRLYYESVEKNKEKEAFLQKIRIEKENEILNSLTFTPFINKNSNLLYEKTHLKIEDKLHNEFKAIKEKQNYARLITEISQRSKSKGKRKNKFVNFNSINNSNNDLKFKTLDEFHNKKSNLILKNSSHVFNLKENNSEGNLLIFRKLENNSKEKNKNENKNKNEREGYNETNEKIKSVFNTYNSTDKNSNLYLDEFSHINKNKNYNTDKSLDDSYLNFKAFQSKYKFEEKNSKAEIKYASVNKENQANATGK